MTSKRKEELLDKFIDDINNDQKPRVYKKEKINQELTPDLEEDFETIRKLKRCKQLRPDSRSNENYRTSESIGRTIVKKPVFKGVAAAFACFLLLFFGGIFTDDNNANIVQAMVEKYEEITGYSAEVKVTSIDNGEVTHETFREINFKKPDLYKAVESWDNVKRTNISDGDTLWIINEAVDKSTDTSNKSVTVEPLFPEKELWRYHLGTQISGIDEAEIIEEMDKEEIAGRSARVIRYKYNEKEEYWHKIWIDEEEKFPLKLILKGGPDSKLVVEYENLEINPGFDENTFVFDELDVDIDSIDKSLTFNKLLDDKQELESLLEREVYSLDKDDVSGKDIDLELNKVGYIDTNWLYQGVLRYEDKEDKENFLDIYQGTAREEEMLLFGGGEKGEVGKIGEDNLLEFLEGETGLFDNYPKPVNYLRFRINGGNAENGKDKVAIVSNLPAEVMVNFAEELTGKQIKLEGY
ncbi:LolA family protein [Natranaerofaba carboxydovora]|uniref:LolA family protein n=1 Tax=Natranaerofaba carboxydovora TaxID=2742683 RepID=UPI001F134114|nr:sigma-E factor regulatory protein RseB domain-containing protein [Natranaerofaba carboxydovora]UMZ75454.1 hypothetical protein ACONDI_03082 [Natranaerofaba carboxydovora]